MVNTKTSASDLDLAVSDIQIGAVEIKNSDSDDRVLVSDANTARAATDHVLLVQCIDASGAVGAGTSDITALGGETLGDHGTAVIDHGIQPLVEAKDYDGAALPNAVTEGQACRPAASLNGVQYVMVVSEDGSSRPAYDSGTDSFKGFEINPLSEHHVEETLLDLTNIAQTTTAYGYIDMDGYRYLTIQGETSGTTPTDVLTVTLEATCQDDGTAAASCVYQDITSALTGVASWVDTDFTAIVDNATMFKYIRVKYVTSTGGGNDADLTVYIKKGY
jgi:hypothetical protein